MARRNQTLLFSLILGQLVLGSLSAPVSNKLGIDDWVTKQPANAGKDEECAKKDAALAATEATPNKLHNMIDPNTKFNPEDGSYKTISECIVNIPDNNKERYVLVLKSGTVFREKLFLIKSKPFVTIRSEDPRNPATIVWNDTATTPGKDGKPLSADGSSTVTIESDYFIAYGVIFKNDAPSGKGGEAPALRVLGTKATFYNCTIDGGQGALYDEKGLHYYKSSTIMGTVDFIFGGAKSFYEDCNIVSLDKNTTMAKVPHPPPVKDITVPPGEGGFAFKTCAIKGEGPYVYLGRVDTPFIFSYTDIDKVLVPLIYDRGNIQTPEVGTGSRGLYYGQFKCFGSGLELSRTSALKYAQAKPFLGTEFISGDSWILSIPPVDDEQ